MNTLIATPPPPTPISLVWFEVTGPLRVASSCCRATWRRWRVAPCSTSSLQSWWVRNTSSSATWSRSTSSTASKSLGNVQSHWKAWRELWWIFILFLKTATAKLWLEMHLRGRRSQEVGVWGGGGTMPNATLSPPEWWEPFQCWELKLVQRPDLFLSFSSFFNIRYLKNDVCLTKPVTPTF